ncbi:MAG: adenine phosphoribosyltransferase [Synechococcales cyanobacterium RM1_1_8]|nr:adenine phosphoribosyltransferase [Synechococcales cyanobacterium RM1_1_8]
MDLKALIRDVPDFPKPGILFRDITTLLQDAAGLKYALDQLTDRCAALSPDYIIGIESRGFIFGMPLADRLGVGFVPVRKPGKLPAAIHGMDYALEYGSDRLELHQDALAPGSRAVIVDDLLATGGTAQAAAQLIDQTEATLAGFIFAIELAGLAGRAKLPAVPVESLVIYE